MSSENNNQLYDIIILADNILISQDDSKHLN